MNNLFNLYHGSEDNDFLATQIELPLTFKTRKNSEDYNTRTVKSDFILRTGSHHGFGLNALLAHKLYHDLSGAGNSSDRLKALHNSNLEVLTSNPHNIGAITQCMPKNSDQIKMIEFAFPGSQYGSFEESDFAFFIKNADKPLTDKPNSGLLLIAEIYAILQRSNRIEADDKLQKKLNAVIAAARS
jgi:hypothetical protein